MHGGGLNKSRARRSAQAQGGPGYAVPQEPEAWSCRTSDLPPPCCAKGVSRPCSHSTTPLPGGRDRLTFPANSVWAQEIGNLDQAASTHDYTVAIAAGKTLQIKLISNDANVYFKVNDQSHEVLASHKTGVCDWSTPNAAATTYTIEVYADHAALPSGQQVPFTLQVGQFAAGSTQHAAAATTASPTTANSTARPSASR